MPRFVTTRPPSFPGCKNNLAPAFDDLKVWQVLFGDENHWRMGIYSPALSSASEVIELERHDCPELFVLLSGSLTLVLKDGGSLRELPLEQHRPILVTAPHSGFCPDGPFSGRALVVERDSFDTEYRTVADWN